MPIQPKVFDLAFREMEIDFTSRGRCNWENYFKWHGLGQMPCWKSGGC